uniref:DDE-1 domain-containing protein n=1 Tax=Amphimedon queenslandica TaxID=400682 RepID=A0A1X7UP58_AMPQE
MYGLTSSGWIDSEIFHGWLCKHFLPHAPGSRPLLLLLDGHSSYYCPDTINTAAEEKIIIFCLPPHTTHRTQPLDKGCFSPLKAYWEEECHDYLKENPGKVLSRSWMKGMTMKNATSGFKTTGILPFNPQALIPNQSWHDANPGTVHSKEVAHAAASPDILFTSEEQTQFQRRLEENYDISDSCYDSWLKRYHPSVLQVPKQSTPADDSVRAEKDNGYEKKAKKDLEMALKKQRKTEREKRKAEKEAQ